MLTLPIKPTVAFCKQHFIALSLIICYLVLGIIYLNGFLLFDYNVVIALLISPLIFKVDSSKKSMRYLLPVLCLLMLSIFVASKTLLFLAIMFGIFLIIENSFGKLSNSILFLLLIISPIFTYVSTIIGFPIRLWLSDVSVKILTGFGGSYQTNGNLITENGYEFSVDQACAGLNMLTTSLIICLFFINYHKSNKQSSFVNIFLLLLITFALNIINNLIRIVLLIKWRIMPEVPLHYIIGIVCLLIYVIIPLYYITRFFFKCAHTNQSTVKNFKIGKLRFPVVHTILICATLFIALQTNGKKKMATKTQSFQIKGFQKELLANGITKLANNESLIYLKPTPFYAPEHNPMVCWKGSGYDFKLIRKETVAGQEIYTGLLIKGKDKIFTAWWFESKQTKTISQVDWRWKAFKDREEFRLINVNSGTNASLNKLLHQMLNN